MSDPFKPNRDDAEQPMVPKPFGEPHESDHDEDFWDLDHSEDGFLAPATPFDKGEEAGVVDSAVHGRPHPIEPRVQQSDTHRVKTVVPTEELKLARRGEQRLAEVSDDFAALEGPEFESFASVPSVLASTPELGPSLSAFVDEGVADGHDLGDGFFVNPSQMDEEVEPAAVPRTMGEWLAGVGRLSVFEKACVLMVVLVLSGFVAIVFLPAIDALPDEKQYTEDGDLPIAGSWVKALAVDTYWRPPVTEGLDADVYRRESVLLPVMEIQVDGGPGVVRVLFRAEDGAVVGDPVTRQVNGPAVLNIVGTTGFAQQGMHAAYRAGQLDPWSVQVFEASSTDAPVEEFKLLFEMRVSAKLR